MAKLAADILRGKQRLHAAVGSTARRVISLFGGRRLEQAIAGELASKLALPFDDQAVAVARGLQITGVLLCVAAGQDLTRCRCFGDMSLTEAKEQVNAVLTTGIDDWSRLADYRAG